MANTVWKGQLTFGLVSFPVRLVRAARKDRMPLRYVREIGPSSSEDDSTAWRPASRSADESAIGPEDENSVPRHSAETVVVAPVHTAYIADYESEPIASRQLQRGYEVAPGQFAVIRSEEIQRLRQPTSSALTILRSVRMEEIDPVFLETSYYVLPGNGGEHPYGLFYRALKESGYAALAEVGMHGRQHVVVLRPGTKGLIAHTMYYVNEVRGAEEHAAEERDVSPKELELAKRFIEALAAPFQPDEFTDRYRQQLEALIASKEPVPSRGRRDASAPAAEKVIDIMDALRQSLEKVAALKATRKPVTPAPRSAKPRKRRA